jgi:AraC-like DNA-binding protein
MMSTIDAFRIASYRGPAADMLAAHRHDDLELNVAREDLRYLIDGRDVVIPAGSVGLFWAARPHRLTAAVADVAWLAVPLALALTWSLPPGLTGRLLAGDVVVVPDDARLASLVDRWRRDLDADPSDAGRRAAHLEIEALLLRLGAESVRDVAASEARPGDAATRPSDATGRMAAFISDRASEDIRIDDVARHVHLHPQYAMTLFRRVLGITIGEYLLQCRVGRAQHLLLTTSLGIPEVGFAAGFQSQSQFYARFRDRCGEPPAAYRRRLAG